LITSVEHASRKGRWIPTFPNAEYLIGRIEFEPLDQTRRRRDSDGMSTEAQAKVNADSVLPIDRCRTRNVRRDRPQGLRRISLMPSFGIRPGHVQRTDCIEGASVASLPGDSFTTRVRWAIRSGARSPNSDGPQAVADAATNIC